MNLHDPDDAVHAAFRARLERAPEPSAAMFARTMAAVDAPEVSQRSRGTAPRPWAALLATPARFATAAAIVVVSGTIAVSTLRTTHARTTGGVVATPAARITLDREGHPAPLLARSGTIVLVVNDIPSAIEAVDAAVHRANGTVVVGRDATSAAAVPTTALTRMLVRVPTRHFAATLDAIAMLGSVRSRSVDRVDLTAAFAANGRAARAAQHGATTAERDRIAHERRLLEARLRQATIAVTLRNTTARRTVWIQRREPAGDRRDHAATILGSRSYYAVAREPSNGLKRPTSIALVGRNRCASLIALRARRRVRVFGHAASDRRAAGSGAA
jgi:hypothetical protein